MKKLLIFILSAFILSAVPVCVAISADELKQTDAFFVNDYAGVIEESYERTICEQGERLYNASKAQVVVVTVDSIDGRSAANFAADLGNAWKLGDGELDNGVVILLVMDSKDIQIGTGSGIGGALPASKCGRIIDTYGIDYLSDGEYGKGLASIYDSVMNELFIYYGLDPDADYEQVEDESESIAVIGMIGAVVMIIVIIIIVAGRGGRHRGGPFLFGGPGSFGGGFPGGHSGGGFSGGGFSGGGGSFGGGGAGRKF